MWDAQVLQQRGRGEAGYEVVTVLVPTDDKAHYYPGAGFFITKLIAEKETHKLLGVQVLGTGAVDKMVDIAVMGLNMGAVLEDLKMQTCLCTAIFHCHSSLLYRRVTSLQQDKRSTGEHDSRNMRQARQKAIRLLMQSGAVHSWMLQETFCGAGRNRRAG